MARQDEAAAKAAVSILGASFARAGLSSWAFLSGDRLRAVCSGLPARTLGRYGLGPAEPPRGRARIGGAAVLSLAYGDGPSSEPAWAAAIGGPRLALGRVARANWYEELILRLDAALLLARPDLVASGLDPGPAGQWRRLANSGLPEKPLALAAGLGLAGRSGLVILGLPGGPGVGGPAREGPDSGSTGHPAIGPGAVLGLLLLPLELGPDLEAGLAEAYDHRAAFHGRHPCEGCGRCVAACPTRALGGATGYERQRCLQHWSALEESPPDFVLEAWKGRLYGCDACLEACPWFTPAPWSLPELPKLAEPAAAPGLSGAVSRDAASPPGALGPGLPAPFFAREQEPEIRRRLSGSALGLSWMSVAAFRRSAALVLGPGEGLVAPDPPDI